MVFEDLINPVKAERRPYETFFIGVIYSSMAILISLFVFKASASMMMVSLTAMVSIPLVYGAIKLEEQKDLEIDEEVVLIKEHGKALAVFIFLFLGFVAAFSAWFIFMPRDMAFNVFSTQISTIEEINSPVTGNAISIGATLGMIIINNLKVMVFCLLFAFFYGFGAILILAWNASVLGALIGSILKAAASSAAVAPMIILKYSLHGIPEVAAYFMAGLAGGIISIAIIRHDFRSERFRHIIVDSLDLIGLAIIIILFAGVIEVFISPYVA